MHLTKYDLNNEIWIDINGYEGSYQISNMGRVKSLDRYITNGKYENRLIKGKVKAIGKNNRDYCIIVLYKNDVGKTNLIHRLVALHFIPNPDNKPDVNHKFGNKDDNRFFMLEWNTKVENTNHAIRNGLIMQNGEDSVLSKLTEYDVLEIRKLNREGWKNIDLSYKFKVCNQNISLIVNRKAWKHV